METKICTNPQCPFGKEPQPITSFYKQSSQRSGYASRCKTCINRSVSAYGKTEAGKITAKKAAQKFRQTEHRHKYAREWAKQAYHTRPDYRQKVILRSRAHTIERREQNPPRSRKPIFEATEKEKESARDAVKYAVRIGKLPHPSTISCRICNNPAVHYHHNRGYDKENWLSVVPLCQRCHDIIHGL